MKNYKQKTIGLYLHIPFCQFLCHYCDFVKTAHWSEALVKSYFEALENHLRHWAKIVLIPEGYKIHTLFIGGGTPSLFTKEYDPIFSFLSNFLAEDAEISFEGNPDNMTKENLLYWKGLGVNRLSIGVQSFSKKGLCTLTRGHSFPDILSSYNEAKKVFDSINLDLIYGWPGQDLALWNSDLEHIVALDPSHVSLYLLTYAGKTPIGRAYQRGKLSVQEDELLESFYTLAREKLSSAGFKHEEVSNWSKNSKSCRHNWLYWQDEPYLAIGAGACGYLPSKESSLGIRYQYTGRERSFCKIPLPNPFASHFDESKAFLLEERSASIWLLEYIGASLRSSKGIDLKRVKRVIGYSFKISPLLEEAFSKGQCFYKGDCLVFSEAEWFRESAWCLKVLECFSSDFPSIP